MLAAYVSTIVTHLNWGSSYLVHDCYRRFIRPGRDERHYVTAGRISTLLLMVIGGFLTFALDTAQHAFQLLLSIGAGTGLLYLLRWFWWRVNAWCEIAAMVSSFVVALGFFIAERNGADIPASTSLLVTVAVTTGVWLATAWLAPATDHDTLLAFYKKVRPAGPGWRRIRDEAGVAPALDSMPLAFLGWTLGCLMVYGALFGTGSLLYGRRGPGVFWSAVFVLSAIGLLRLIPRLWSSASES
jgi:hypothetical protein